MWYAPTCLKLIKGWWREVLSLQMNTGADAKIIATLYSLGLFKSDATERKPHAGAEANEFGERAGGLFEGFALRLQFRD